MALTTCIQYMNLVKFLSASWMILDIILDILCVDMWRKGCAKVGTFAKDVIVEPMIITYNNLLLGYSDLFLLAVSIMTVVKLK